MHLFFSASSHTNLRLIEQIEKASHQNHLINERKVMMELDHPFMPKLYTTFKVNSVVSNMRDIARDTLLLLTCTY